MRQLKNRFFWLAIAMVLAMSLLAACSLPNGFNIITINEFGYTAESGIVSLAPPGLVPQPPSFIEATGYSEYVKTPHTLEGRIGYCLDHHGVTGEIPAPASHLGRPQDSCTVCHQPAWQVIE